MQLVPRRESIPRQQVRVVSGGVVREHASEHLRRRSCHIIQTHWIVRPINSEWRVYHWQEDLKFKSRGHSRLPVGATQHRQVLMETFPMIELSKGLRIYAVERNWILFRATKLGLVQSRELLVINSQLRRAQDGIHAEVNKWRNRHRSRYGDTVFSISHQAQIAARESDLLKRNWNRVSPASQVARVFGNHRTIRIPQTNRGCRRDESYWRDCTNIESPQIVFSTHVKALKRGRPQPAVARHKRSLSMQANGVAALL